MVGCISTPYIIPKWFEGRLAIMVSALFLGILTLQIGPFWEEKNITAMLIGLTTQAIFFAPTVIPNMSEMMLSTHLKYPDADLEHANNLLGGLMNCCFGVGQGLGPLFGSAIYQTMGFRALCDTTAGLTVLFSILYFIFGQGYLSISQTCKNFGEHQARRTLSQEEILTDEMSKIR